MKLLKSTQGSLDWHGMQPSGVGVISRSGKQRIQHAPTIFGMTRFVEDKTETSRSRLPPRKAKGAAFDQKAELAEVSRVEMPVQGPSWTVLPALAGGARRIYLIGIISLRKLIQPYQGYQDFIF